jgi:hypothetical protein
MKLLIALKYEEENYHQALAKRPRTNRKGQYRIRNWSDYNTSGLINSCHTFCMANRRGEELTDEQWELIRP